MDIRKGLYLHTPPLLKCHQGVYARTGWRSMARQAGDVHLPMSLPECLHFFIGARHLEQQRSFIGMCGCNPNDSTSAFACFSVFFTASGYDVCFILLRRSRFGIEVEVYFVLLSLVLWCMVFVARARIGQVSLRWPVSASLQ